MENQMATNIDDLVIARLLHTRLAGATEEPKVVEVSNPTLDSPPISPAKTRTGIWPW